MQKSSAHLSLPPTPSAIESGERTAYLVDEYWAEFDRYIQSTRTGRDSLLLPVTRQQTSTAKYAWQTVGFGRVRQYRSILAVRMAQSVLLRIVRQGAKYQQLLLTQAIYLARIYGRSLPDDTTHVVVTQSLLPHLWRSGRLADLSFDVLMTALPMEQLQQRLDRAAAYHPQSPTLDNFRVSPELAIAEMAALRQACNIITPHRELATLWIDKTHRLDWVMPAHQKIDPALHEEAGKAVVVLPSASIGRKGIYELRAALTGLNILLIIAGGELEDPDFWQGYEVIYQPNYQQALRQATIVVAPAWVDHQPRKLLQAIALGIPTICSTACGLPDMPGVIQVPIGEPIALKEAIASCLPYQFAGRSSQSWGRTDGASGDRHQSQGEPNA